MFEVAIVVQCNFVTRSHVVYLLTNKKTLTYIYVRLRKVRCSLYHRALGYQ